MLWEWFPIEPVIDVFFRVIHYRVTSENIRTFFTVLGFFYAVTKWEKQRLHGSYRDATDREQNRRLDLIEGNTPMEFIKSPNYTKGRLLRSPKFVVIHSMAGTMQGSIITLQNPKREASAHYMVGHDGRIVQMVDEKNTAWHAGNWLANLDSIGIEHEGGRYNDLDHPLQEEGYKASARLLADIHRRYNWGEPSSKTMRTHREVSDKPTACPSGLDMGRLIQTAQDEYHGRSVPLPEAPKPQPVRVFKVGVTSNVYIRTPDNLTNGPIGKITKGSTAFCVEARLGERVGDTTWWLRLQDPIEVREKDGVKHYAGYIWAGATNFDEKNINYI